MTKKAQEIKEIFTQKGVLCNYCRTEDYCLGNCELIEKAKKLNNKQWEDIAKRYDIYDFYDIAKSIKNRKALNNDK